MFISGLFAEVEFYKSNHSYTRRQNLAANMEAGNMHPPTTTSSVGGAHNPRKRQMNLTLDLESASNPSRRKQVQTLLTSPDVQMLKLNTPELEKFLSQNPSLATPTPSGYTFPVTEEQAQYAKGFELALEQVKKQQTSAVVTGTTAGDPLTSKSALSAAVTASFSSSHHASSHEAATTLAGLSNAVVNHYNSNNLPLSLPNHPASVTGPLKVQIKDEPDDISVAGSSHNLDHSHLSGDYSHQSGGDHFSAPSSISPIPSNASTGDGNSQLSPLDMDNQEQMKLERKRMRNRMAASKCRKRKLEKIAQLDERVKQLKNENSDLAAVVKKMKSSVAQLKQEVLEHAESGCEIRFAGGIDGNGAAGSSTTAAS